MCHESRRRYGLRPRGGAGRSGGTRAPWPPVCREACERQGITRGSQLVFLMRIEEEKPPVSHQMPDPQVDLVRRYARILRSARAEALRVRRQEAIDRATATRLP